VVIVSYEPLFQLRRRIENSGDWEIDYDVVVAGPGVNSLEAIVSTPSVMSEIVLSVAETLTEWGTPVTVAQKMDSEAGSASSNNMSMIIMLAGGIGLVLIIILFCLWLKFLRSTGSINIAKRQSTAAVELTAGDFDVGESDFDEEDEEKTTRSLNGLTRGTSFILQRIQARIDHFVPGEWRHADGKVKIKKNGELSYIVKDGGQCFSAIVNQKGKFEVFFPGGSISAKIKNENTMIWDDGAEWSRVNEPKRTKDLSGDGRTTKRKQKKKNNAAEDRYTAVKKYPEKEGTPEKQRARNRNQEQDDIILIGSDDESSSTSLLYMKNTPSAEGKESSSLIVVPNETNDTGEMFRIKHSKEKRNWGDPGPLSRRKPEMQNNNRPQGSRSSYAEEGLMITEAPESRDSPSEVNQVVDPEFKTRDMLNELWGDSS